MNPLGGNQPGSGLMDSCDDPPFKRARPRINCRRWSQLRSHSDSLSPLQPYPQKMLLVHDAELKELVEEERNCTIELIIFQIT